MKQSTTPICSDCGTELTDDNWYPGDKKRSARMCKKCRGERNKAWAKENPDRHRAIKKRWKQANPEKVKESRILRRRKAGVQSMHENRECSSFLGIHVAERVLYNVFKDVERMPINNSGYDFICRRNMKIDVKSGCINKYGGWSFHIDRNDIADYFLCIAFDNRNDLTPMHLWLIPSEVVNNKRCASVCPSTVEKWGDYQLDISKTRICCEGMK